MAYLETERKLFHHFSTLVRSPEDMSWHDSSPNGEKRVMQRRNRKFRRRTLRDHVHCFDETLCSQSRQVVVWPNRAFCRKHRQRRFSDNRRTDTCRLCQSHTQDPEPLSQDGQTLSESRHPPSLFLRTPWRRKHRSGSHPSRWIQ